MKFLKNVKRVYKYSLGSRKYIFAYIFLSLVMTIIGTIIPILTSLQLVNFTSGVWDKVVLYSIFFFAISIFDMIVNYINFFLVDKFNKKIMNKLQLDFGKEILKIELSDIDSASNGLFIERLTNDTRDMVRVFTSGVHYFSSLLSKLGIFIIIFSINFWVGITFIIYIAIEMILQRIKNKKVDDKDKSYRSQKERTSGFATELIRGIRDIKMLNAEDSFVNKIEENILLTNEKQFDISITRRIYNSISEVLEYIYDLVLIVLLILFIKNNHFDIALGIVIYNYRHNMTGLIYIVNGMIEFVREFNLSCNRVFEIFDGKVFKKEKFGKKHLDKINGDFEFNNVDFSYGSNKVLDNISFKVSANTTVGFVGKSGAGKTTIFNLLCKLYDVESGTIKIDGIDITKLDKDTIRGNISIISQNPYIFNMSIKDNLKLVKEDVTDEEIKEACKIACLDKFIETLPDKYDTMIGEGGVNLSGGQRQRLAIARALVQKTEIILFDEATSALDNETQAEIQKSITSLKGEYTILIIAHRLSTIINCDTIMFIDSGKVVAQGTHKELLKNSKEYKELYNSEELIGN